jgi:hypothetical protein
VHAPLLFFTSFLYHFPSFLQHFSSFLHHFPSFLHHFSSFCYRFSSRTVHRGAAVEVADGVEGVSITGNTFKNLGGNGLLLSNHVAHSLVHNNEFEQVRK